ncbi:MAG: transaldolase [Paracoccaceae bacterium]|jgi:transaldolase|tara:strand:+ start:381 stop:524 length:144 start_codon:yes stop_codon:yes gene_type:complete
MSEATVIGTDVATAPPFVIKKLAGHSLTDKGLATFTSEWAKSSQNIL